MRKLMILLISVLMFSGCTPKQAEPVSQTSFLLNTISTISVYNMPEEKANKIIEDTFALCSEYENKLSKTISSSEISKINSSNGEWVEVSDETAELINLSLKYSEISNGKFDITISPVTDLWDFNGNGSKKPAEHEIAEALKHVGYENIEISGNKIRLSDPKASIDLGGIAKGFIGDKAKEFMLENGVSKAIISLGGNILLIGPEDEDHLFSVGIQEPFSQTGVLFGKLYLKDTSVVTSGVYERFLYDNNTLYHHILDTNTGYSANTGLNSVTIISSSSADADALSTTCFLLGAEKGMELIENTDDTEAVFITDKNEPIYSSGINKTIKFETVNNQ